MREAIAITLLCLGYVGLIAAGSEHATPARPPRVLNVTCDVQIQGFQSGGCLPGNFMGCESGKYTHGVCTSVTFEGYTVSAKVDCYNKIGQVFILPGCQGKGFNFTDGKCVQIGSVSGVVDFGTTCSAGTTVSPLSILSFMFSALQRFVEAITTFTT